MRLLRTCSSCCLASCKARHGPDKEDKDASGSSNRKDRDEESHPKAREEAIIANECEDKEESGSSPCSDEKSKGSSLPAILDQ